MKKRKVYKRSKKIEEERNAKLQEQNPPLVHKSRYRVINPDGYGPEVYDVTHVSKWRKEWGYMFEGVAAEGGGYTYYDNGTTVHIEGPCMSIDLDYMQVEAMFRLLSLADRHSSKYGYDSTGWSTTQVIETRLVKRKKGSKQ
tara:strand:+ start:168 stop:593 length:426 start_codon:yes stop_codon:yes gene_type:complete